MSVERSFTVTLKLATSNEGVFESVRLLKGRSTISADVLDRLNAALQVSLVPEEAACDELTLAQITPITQTSVAIGACAERRVMHHLRAISQVNQNFRVRDTSGATGHGDMAVDYQGTRICVEVKNYSKPVPAKEIEKFVGSLAMAEYDAGIMIQHNACGYAVKAGIRSPIDIRLHNDKLAVYLTASDPELLYPIIAFMASNHKLAASANVDELETKRQALLHIHEQVTELRSCIDAQKKVIARMEASVGEVARLSCL